MTKKGWAELITQQLQGLDTFDEAFLPVIDTLASTLYQRDKIYTEFKKNGGKSTIEYTNKNGSTNLVKNPQLVLWDDLNKSALAYWKELGLTPSSYKKLTDNTERKGGGSALEKALQSITL